MCLFQIVGWVLHLPEAQHRCGYLFIIQAQQSKQYHFAPPFFHSHTMLWVFSLWWSVTLFNSKKAWIERKGLETRNCLYKGLKWLTAQLSWAQSPDILSAPPRSQTCCPRHTCQVLREKQLCHTLPLRLHTCPLTLEPLLEFSTGYPNPFKYFQLDICAVTAAQHLSTGGHFSGNSPSPHFFPPPWQGPVLKSPW